MSSFFMVTWNAIKLEVGIYQIIWVKIKRKEKEYLIFWTFDVCRNIKIWDWNQIFFWTISNYLFELSEIQVLFWVKFYSQKNHKFMINIWLIWFLHLIKRYIILDHYYTIIMNWKSNNGCYFLFKSINEMAVTFYKQRILMIF